MTRGLESPSLEPLTRIALSRLRGMLLFGRGRLDEAERIAVELVGVSAKGGARAHAANAMALAARCAGRPEAGLLRWLGAFALSTGGTAARMEHSASPRSRWSRSRSARSRAPASPSPARGCSIACPRSTAGS